MKEGLLAIVKFFSFLLVLPLIIAIALAFQSQVFGLPVHKEQWFVWGIVAFMLMYLFLYNFKEVHIFGQTIVANLLKFFEPLGQVGTLIVPIYTVLIICLYLILNVLGLSVPYERYLILAVGFSVVMHVVLTAHQLYEADSGPIKAQYLFAFGLAFIANIFIIALLLGLVIQEFSFIGFFKALSHHASSYYQAIYKILFVSP
jgi:hypothetical protein